MAEDVQGKLDPREPTFGWTLLGHAVHAVTIDHLPSATAVQRFNARAAVVITRSVGTMWCAWAFCALALVSAPGAFATGSVLVIVAWASQTLLQLTLLSVIMVGQGVQAQAADARAAKTFEDVEHILAALGEAAGRLEAIHAAVGELTPKPIAMRYDVQFPSPRLPPEE